MPRIVNRKAGRLGCRLGLAVALVFALSGCGYVAGLAVSVASAVGGGGRTGSGGTAAAGTTAEVVDTPRPQGAIQKVVVQVADQEGEPVALELGYRAGAAGAFRPAPLAEVHRPGDPSALPWPGAPGTRTPELPAAPTGTSYELWWRWADDLGAGAHADVSLQLSVVSARSGGAPSVAFQADQLKIGNDAPVISNVQTRGSSGLVLVSYDLEDSTADPVQIIASFLVNGASTSSLTALDQAALQNVPAPSPASPSTTPFQFLWDSQKDLSAATSNVQVRLVAFDGQLQSAPALSAPFTVVNNQNDPPEAVVQPVDRKASGPVKIVYDLFDREGDPADLTATWFLEGGSASGTPREVLGAGSDGLSQLTTSAGGTRHLFLWDREAEPALGAGAHEVRFRIDPQGAGATGSEVFLVVGNAAPVATVSSSFAADRSGEIEIPYTLFDSTGDRASVTWEISTNGVDFVRAATVSGTSFLDTRTAAGDPAPHAFIWQSAANLPAAAHQAVTLRVRPTDGLPGGLGSYVQTTLTVTNGGGAGGGGGGLPSVAITPPGRAVTGTLPLAITLADPLSRPIDVEALVRLATSTMWAAVSTTSPLGGLSSTPAGAAHTIDWDFEGQLGAGARRVVVRLTPTASSTPGGADETAPFWVGNDAPVLAATSSLPGVQHGVVAVPFTLFDSSADPVSLTVSYATSSAVSPALATALSATAGLVSQDPADPQKPYSHTFLWDAPHDLAGYAGPVYLSLTPSDGFASGATATVTAALDFNQPPTLQVAAPPREVVGPVSLPFTLADPEADPVDVVASWRLATSTAGWAAVSTTPPLAGLTGLAASPTGSSHTLEWDFATQLPDGAHRVVVRLTPTDAKGKSGPAAWTFPFEVGNDPPVATITSVTSSVPGSPGGDIEVLYTLFDSSGDPASVVVEYATSTAPGASFYTAASPSSTTGLATDDGAGGAVAHGFLWQSAVDLPAAFGQTVVLRLRPDDSFGGQGAAVTTSLTITNGAGPGGGGPAPPGAVTVSAASRSFSPDVPLSVTVQPGTTELWVWVVTSTGAAPMLANLTSTASGTISGAGHVTGLSGAAATTFTVTWGSSYGPSGPAGIGLILRFRPSGPGGDGPARDYGPFTVGNTAPIVQWVTPTGGATSTGSNVLLQVRLVDAESDPVDLALTYQRPGGATITINDNDLLGSATTTALSTAPGPSGLLWSFVWNAENVFGQVLLADVTLTATSTDGDPATHESPTSTTVIVDTRVATTSSTAANAAPALLVDELSFNADHHAPTVLTYQLFDADSDPVEVVWQWAEDGASFPDLGMFGDLATSTVRATVLASSTMRASLHILTERDVALEGTVPPSAAASTFPPDELQIRSPLAAYRLQDPSLVGATLELERTATFSLLATVTGTPTAVSIEPGGVYALVGVDAGGLGQQVLEISLATGAVRRTFPTSFLSPITGVSVEPDGKHALALFGLSSSGAVVPVVVRIDLGTETSTPVYFGIVAAQGVQALPGGAALVTDGPPSSPPDPSGSLGYVSAAGAFASVTAGLLGPRGVVVSPDLRTAYVAELGLDRVLAIDLQTHGRRTVQTVLPAGKPPLTAPTWLALRPDGRRLLVVAAGAAAGTSRLLEVDLLTGQTEVLEDGLPTPSGIACGPGDMVLWVLGAASEIWKKSPTTERRHIAAVLPNATTPSGPARVQLDSAFVPSPPQGGTWRLLRGRNDGAAALLASPTGARHTFAWDVLQDVALAPGSSSTGMLRVRGTPFDTQRGHADTTRERKKFRDREPSPRSFALLSEVGGLGVGALSAVTPVPDLALGDLDGDGRLDLVWPLDDPSPSLAGQIYVSHQTGSAGVRPFAFALPIKLVQSVADSVSAFALGDTDADGRLDIVLADRTGDKIVVLTQTSLSGTVPEIFAETTVTSTDTLAPAAIALADLNRDGLLDIVSGNDGASTGTSTLTVLNQDTSGVFSEKHKVALSTQVAWQQVLTADMNGDGVLDVLATTQPPGGGAGTLRQFVRDGSGALSSSTKPLSVAASEVAVGDVDRDGDIDAVIWDAAGTAANTVQVFLNDGSGLAGSPVLSAVETSVQMLQLYDADGDGLLDVAIRRLASTGDTVTVYRQTAAGVFATSPDPIYRLPHQTHVTGVRAPVLADVDGDGRTDLFWNTLDIYKTFESRISWPAPGDLFGGTRQTLPSLGGTSGAGLRELIAADLDGDGTLDLVTLNDGFGAYGLIHYRQDPAGTFRDTPSQVLGLLHKPVSLAIGDLDDDGHPEAVVGLSGGGVRVLPGIEGGFTTTSAVWLAATTTVQDVALADLQADGDLDLAVVVPSGSGTAGEVRVFENAGSGLVMTTWQTIPIPDAFAVALGDLDGDGAVDLAVARTNQSAGGGSYGKIDIFQQIVPAPGAGGGDIFATTTPWRTLTWTGGDFFPTQVLVLDLDRDGRQDLVTASVGAGIAGAGVDVFLQRQRRSFSSVHLPLGPGGRLTAGDLDGDGLVDLAYSFGETVELVRQRSPGSFDPDAWATVRWSSSTFRNVRGLVLSDLDGDGVLDLAVAKMWSNRLVILKQGD